MKKLLTLFIILFFVQFQNSFARDFYQFEKNGFKKNKKSNFDKTRLLIGPGIGAGAGYRQFSINLSPTVAYAFHENFYVGTTLGFNYSQFSETYYNPIDSQNHTFKHKYPGYSMSVFARYLFKDILFLNFEPELNNIKFVKDYQIDNFGKIIEIKQRTTIASVLVGVGYIQRFSKYGHSYFSINYDLLQNPNARYYETVDLRFGYIIQLFN